MVYQCPVCSQVIPSATTTDDGRKRINAPFFPFCSERCRLLDLGAWLDERYRVAAEPYSGPADHDVSETDETEAC